MYVHTPYPSGSVAALTIGTIPTISKVLNKQTQAAAAALTRTHNDHRRVHTQRNECPDLNEACHTGNTMNPKKQCANQVQDSICGKKLSLVQLLPGACSA